VTTNKLRFAALSFSIACTSPQAGTDARAPTDASAPPTVAITDAAPVDAQDEPDAAPDIDAMSDRAMNMVEHVAALIDANKRDCRVLGEKLSEYYRENAAFVVQAKELYATMPEADRKKIQKRFRKRFDAAWRTLQPTIKKCKDDSNVKDVLDKVF